MYSKGVGVEGEGREKAHSSQLVHVGVIVNDATQSGF